ncbi:MAG: DUF4384 domain-containing protein [Desulfamplus sp.]|nr:DUF4384 domain-containing protein [Desulfamplus sp.]
MKQNPNILLFFIIFLSLNLLSGCVTVPTPEIDKKFENLETPTKRISQFDNSLEKLGKLLEIYQIEPVAIQAKPIVNYTAGETLPSNITIMVSSALAKIGERIVYLPYDPSYFLNEHGTGGAQTIGRRLPDIFLDGGITEYDKDIDRVSSRAGGDIAVGGGSGSTDLGVSRSASQSMSSIALDFQLFRYSDTSAIHGTQSSNSIKIYKQNKSNDFSFAILMSGISLNGSVDKTQGEHAAIRLLVEMSILETLGKYAKVPYWLCVNGMAADKNVVQFHKDAFNTKTDQQKIAIIQRQLRYLRYPNVQISGVLDETTIAALRKVLPNMPKIQLNGDLYVKLWSNMDIDFAYSLSRQEMLGQKIAATRAAAPPAAPTTSTSSSPAASSAPASNTKLGLNVENIKSVYKVGERVTFSVAPTDSGFLYVFYDSSKDGFGKVFPNKYERDNFLKPNQKIKVASSKHVVLKTESARVNEKVYFIYSRNDLAPIVNQTVGDGLSKDVNIQTIISAIQSTNIGNDAYIVYGMDINKED